MGRTAAYWAWVHENPEVLDHLLRAGAQASTGGWALRTPLVQQGGPQGNPLVVAVKKDDLVLPHPQP